MRECVCDPLRYQSIGGSFGIRMQPCMESNYYECLHSTPVSHRIMFYIPIMQEGVYHTVMHYGTWAEYDVITLPQVKHL